MKNMAGDLLFKIKKAIEMNQLENEMSVIRMEAAKQNVTDAELQRMISTEKRNFQVKNKAVTAAKKYKTMSDIKGTDIWANFTETEEGVLCELRSAGPNINPIAVKYGGGGHQKASGCTLKDREEAMKLLDDLNSLSEAEA